MFTVYSIRNFRQAKWLYPYTALAAFMLLCKGQATSRKNSFAKTWFPVDTCEMCHKCYKFGARPYPILRLTQLTYCLFYDRVFLLIPHHFQSENLQKISQTPRIPHSLLLTSATSLIFFGYVPRPERGPSAAAVHFIPRARLSNKMVEVVGF